MVIRSGRPLRLVVMASSALDRKGLSAHLPKHPQIELVAVCASLSATLDKMHRDRIDVVAIDASVEEFALNELKSFARDRTIRFLPFYNLESAEATAERLIVLLCEPEARGVDRPAAAKPDVGLVCERGELLVVAIGSSTGGPDALADLIPRLPRDFQPTILIVQHMPPAFTPILARRLEQRGHQVIHEATDGELLRPGLVLIAPGDYHLEVSEDGRMAQLHQGLPEHSCRPAVDVLFRSVAKVFGAHAIGVVLTGMGRDGLDGSRQLRAAGADVLVQDEDSSVVWGMPGLIAREGLCTVIAPIPEIARKLADRARGRNSDGDLRVESLEHTRNT